MTQRDWLEDCIETNTVGKPIVQTRRLAQAIREEIAKRLPEEQFANSNRVEIDCTVEGYNDCLNQVKKELL